MAAENDSTFILDAREGVHYKALDYKDKFNKNLNDSRINGIFCDVVLVVENKKFPCHRVVLNSATEFFEAILNCDFQEKGQKEILLDVSAAIMEDILRFIYTGEISLKKETAEEILVIADYLLLSSLKNVVESFISNKLTYESPLYYLQFAVKYNCNILEEHAMAQVLCRFQKEKENPCFLELEEDTIRDIISSDLIDVTDEKEVFDDLVRWVNHKPNERVPKFAELFQNVRLCFVNPLYIREFISKHELVLNSPECMSAIVSTLCSFVPHKGLPEDKLFTPRKCLSTTLHLFVGGSTGRKHHFVSPSYGLVYWNESDYFCQPERTFSFPKRHGSAQVGNSLFILGGIKKREVLKNAKQINLYTGVTSQLPPMLHGRASPAVMFHNGLLYVIGGSDKDGEAMADVECYNSSTNEWSSMPSLQEPRINASAVSCNQSIYCIGGQSTATDVAIMTNVYYSVERFNAETNEWEFVASMSEARTCVTAVVISDEIYVIGGDNDRFHPTRTCEIYNPSANMWSLLPSMEEERASYAACAFEDEIYVYGGYDSRGNACTDIDVYDTEAMCWKSYADDSLPWGLAEFKSYKFCLPIACVLKKLKI